MANWETEAGLNDFIRDLSSVDIAVLAPKALQDAEPIVEKRLRERSQQHISKLPSGGAMVKSIKPRKVQEKKGKWSVFIGPSGTDKRGVRNMEKMAYLEYGVASHNQRPTPVLTPTIRETHNKVIDNMQASFDKYMTELGL